MRKGSGWGEYGINKRRLGAEGGQIGIQRRGAAGVEEQHVGALGEVSLTGQIDEAGHGLGSFAAEAASSTDTSPDCTSSARASSSRTMPSFLPVCIELAI